MTEFKDAMVPKDVQSGAITGPSGSMLVDPKDVQFLDIEDPSFDVKTFGERAELRGSVLCRADGSSVAPDGFDSIGENV